MECVNITSMEKNIHAPMQRATKNGLTAFQEHKMKPKDIKTTKEMLKKAKGTEALELQKMFNDYPKVEVLQKELESLKATNLTLNKDLGKAKTNNRNEIGALKDGFNKEKGEMYLTLLESNKNIKKTASGLMYEVIQKGKGAKPALCRMVFDLYQALMKALVFPLEKVKKLF